LIIACDEDKGGEVTDGDSATITFEMTNDTSESLMNLVNTMMGEVTFEYLDPTYMGLKILSVDIYKEEHGANDGSNFGGAIWLNPGCAKDEKTFDIEDDEGNIVQYPYMYSQGCSIKDIDTYFDLARDSDVVNDDLNSQGLPLPPGEYTYMQIRLGGGDDVDDESTNRLSYLATGMTEAFETPQSGGGGIGLTLSTPFVLEKEGTATISLSYDLAGTVSKKIWPDGETMPTDDTNSECYEDTDNNTAYCNDFGAGNITPSISN
jgi:hypothetical protein